MTVAASTIERCAQALWRAECERKPIACLSAGESDLDEADAYAIQARKFALRASPAVGFKLGYTSAAMRAQMGIAHPNYGVLSADHRLPDDAAVVPAGQLIHPRVEPEIALLVGRDLEGEGLDRAAVYRHVDAVMPALEIVDTRYLDYDFHAPDNIADNSSSARYVCGPPRALHAVGDLRLLGVLLSSGGRVLEQGIGAAALGDPLLALAWLAGALAARGQRIEAGSVILTGGLTRAPRALPGQGWSAEFAMLGTVGVHFDPV